MIVASDPAGLGKLNSLIHDRWFDAEALLYDEMEHALTIPFDSKPIRSAFRYTGRRMADSILVIHNVVSYSIDDGAQIRYYGFGEMSYDTDTRVLRIKAIFPFTLAVETSALEVRLKALA